jgi:hypothetical protein
MNSLFYKKWIVPFMLGLMVGLGIAVSGYFLKERSKNTDNGHPVYKAPNPAQEGH